MLKRFLTSALCFCSTLAAADELRTTFESTRARGRGNASSAAMLSDEAIRINPAALGEAKGSDFQIRWAELSAYIGENAIETIGDIIDIAQSNSDASAILDTFSEKFGDRQYASLQLFPLGLRWGWFDVEPFIVNRNFLELRIPTVPEFTMNSDTLVGTSFGLGIPFGKTFSLGLSMRVFQRFQIGGSISATDLLVLATDDSAKFSDFIPTRSGAMLGADLGAIWQAGKMTRLSFLIRDLGDTASLSSTGDGPDPIKQSLNVGLMHRIALAKWLNFDSHVEVKDLLNRQGINYLRLFHGGVEFASSYFTADNDLGIQAGLSEGYLSFGAFVDLWLARFGIANYGVETGTYPGQRQDRRWAFTANSSVTF